jgi:ubiquinone/menaquinone biosynthesis C-methylase UbiE
MDAIAQMKQSQRQGWGLFAPLEVVTATSAPRLVSFAQIRPGMRVLDVACGTGVLAMVAARAGAHTTGLDLSPDLLQRARENAQLAQLEIEWHEGDVEELPFAAGSFDAVLSQFGHMFAPRPDVTVREMLRVLKPGGTIAFSTWPPELYMGRTLALVGRYLPPPPPGVAPPPQWGDPGTVRERLGAAVKDLVFDRAVLQNPTLSPQHLRTTMEQVTAPIVRVVKSLESDPPRLAQFRREFEEIAELYYEPHILRQDYLMTRAVKV